VEKKRGKEMNLMLLLVEKRPLVLSDRKFSNTGCLCPAGNPIWSNILCLSLERHDSIAKS
jgi:hypothetical protein